jgi:hypothetical protein
VKKHKWFKGIDWEALYNRQIPVTPSFARPLCMMGVRASARVPTCLCLEVCMCLCVEGGLSTPKRLAAQQQPWASTHPCCVAMCILFATVRVCLCLAVSLSLDPSLFLWGRGAGADCAGGTASWRY